MLKPPQSLPLPQPQPTVAGIINTFHWAWNRNRESMYNNIVFFFLCISLSFCFVLFGAGSAAAGALWSPVSQICCCRCQSFPLSVWLQFSYCTIAIVVKRQKRDSNFCGCFSLWFRLFAASSHFMQITCNFIKAFHLQFCRSILLAARFVFALLQTALTSHIYCCLLIFFVVRVYSAFSAFTSADNNK